jgi:hypothetical protein
MMDSRMERWNRGAEQKKRRIGIYLMGLADGLGDGTLAAPEISPIIDVLEQEIESLIKSYGESSPQGTATLRVSFLEVLDLYLQGLDKLRNYVATEDRQRLDESKALAERAVELTDIIQVLMKENEEFLKDSR